MKEKINFLKKHRVLDANFLDDLVDYVHGCETTNAEDIEDCIVSYVCEDIENIVKDNVFNENICAKINNAGILLDKQKLVNLIDFCKNQCSSEEDRKNTFLENIKDWIIKIVKPHLFQNDFKQLNKCLVYFTEYEPIFCEEEEQQYIFSVFLDDSYEIYDYYLGEKELEYILNNCKSLDEIDKTLNSLDIQCFNYEKFDSFCAYVLQKPVRKEI
ncbi:hypothetical protein [Campylobacter sp. RM12651]|uniref:hypothetical protein n=1 Tax=Campylobacter sp. RM12651 TaxID=1660079 RepID=UPI001EFB5BE2|nr:hypothetical protein [Campylobacter sp. RM12651]ULO04539.1 hypothetical protein AVBRAN_a0057 [Campylobacter sp. RM12651]